MKFKGRNFRKSNTLVIMPIKKDDPEWNYAKFGKVVKDGNSIPPEAVETHYRWPETGNPVFAVQVQTNGYSLTNMAYGNDGRIYLAYDGRVFTAKK